MYDEHRHHDGLVFGLAAEFDSPDAVLEAAHKTHDAGYRNAEAYTPFPVTGLAEALGMRRTCIAPLVAAGAAIGGSGAFFMQWFANVVHLPWNVAGKPPNSWPMFIPITFELSILFGAFVGVLGMLALNRLPRPYHPMFRLPRFENASRNRFFLCIEADDPQFEPGQTRTFLESLQPLAVMEVPR